VAALRPVFARLVSFATYPALVVGPVVVAGGLLAAGLSPMLTLTLAFLASLLVLLVLERRFPHVASWNGPAAGRRQDVVYLLVASALLPVGRLAGRSLAALATLALLPFARGGGPPWDDVPTWMTLTLAFLLADLGKYGMHRLAHERAWLWRFHAEHHAPVGMRALNATRLHPVNLLWNLALDAGLPLAFGLGGRGVALLAVFRGSVSLLQHANVELRLGVLDWVFSTPTLHQWHHSAVLDESNANYGSTLIVWDVLFGTRRLPKARAVPAALGLAEGLPHPTALLHQLVWPWCHARAATGVVQVTDALLSEGFSDGEVANTMGENTIRVLLQGLPP
jgi:sterol desaturase/sphingolipid hydroxylase (fatty acid hydroxylase superfamily)